VTTTRLDQDARSGALPPPERGRRVFVHGPSGGRWAATVAGRRSDLVALAPPAGTGGAVPPPVGARLRLEYVVGDVPLEAEGAIVAVPAPGAPGVYVVRLAGAPARVQRRGAVRVPVRLVVSATLGGDEGEAIGGVTDNLSVSGALMRTPRALVAGRRVRLQVADDRGGTLELAGRCVRCDRLPDAPRAWRAAIAFDELGPAAEDRLAGLVLGGLRRPGTSRSA
jgi:hypothetical protein